MSQETCGAGILHLQFIPHDTAALYTLIRCCITHICQPLRSSRKYVRSAWDYYEKSTNDVIRAHEGTSYIIQNSYGAMRLMHFG
jgi:hypothetical protein